MRKTLLLAIVALSIHAFAQRNQPALNLMGNVPGRMELTGKTTSHLQSGRNFKQTLKLQAHKPGDLIQVFDSDYVWRWDTLSIGWGIAYKENNFLYDARHNLTGYTDQYWNGSFWENGQRFIFTYDVNYNQTSDLAQTWTGINWENLWQDIYTYDASNNQTSYLSQTWSGSAWVNSEQYIYTYDTKNNQTSDLSQNWDGSTWVNSYKDTYTYDVNNNMTNALDQDWDGSTWVNYYNDTYTYDANNNLTNALDQYWDGSTWVDSYKGTYTYDANNNRTNSLYQEWTGSEWVKSGQYIYTYDASNNRTSGLYQTWNVSAWVNYEQFNITYDADNFVKSYSYKYWNLTGTEVTYGDSLYYYYHTFLGINDLLSRSITLKIYPNPSSGQVTIETSAIPGNDQLSIVNLNGQEVITRQITEPKTQLDISGLQCGVYFVRLTGEGKITIGKIIKK
jgi:hypothetical protein